MDLDQQPNSSRNVGGTHRTSALMMGKSVIQSSSKSSLSADTKMKILAAEMELLNDFLRKKHGVRVLNVNSAYFKALHQPTFERDRIKRSLDASLTATPQTEPTTNDERGGDDLDETLIVVKEEPNWSEEDTLVVDPGEADADSDQRTDFVEGNGGTTSVSEGSGLNAEERADASLAEPRSTNGAVGTKHKCRYCEKTFGRKSDMKRHEMTHTGEMPFKCRFCPKKFSDKSNKRVHKRIHSNERPFSCQFCPKKFTTKYNKTVHERIHKDEKPFNCELCDATFRHRETKTGHMRTHTREKLFQCEHCEARFGSKAEKVKHMRVHTGEKPFHCEYCDKRFSGRSSLVNHLRIHTKEKPYVCSICGNAFNQTSNLRRHKKTHLK